MTQSKVSVVIATWNRGQHILPTLRSVFAQTMQDFEIIVVGDGCTDDTEQVLQPYLSDRLRWFNLPHNTGSQAFPNNVGIAKARGSFIAYLGHDDIWDRRHLEFLVAEFQRDPGLGFVSSGILVWGPLGADVYLVYGLIETDADKFTHPLIPSAVMHTRAIAMKLGGWQSPMRTLAPTDQNFFQRAARMGIRFSSTGKITAHKLSTSQRYLFYCLPQDSTEQSHLLDLLSQPDCDVTVTEFVEKAKASRRYMSSRHADYSQYAPGQLHRESRIGRGLSLPILQELGGGQTIEKSNEARALDWHAAVESLPYRLSGPNPRPKLLIPFSHNGRVACEIDVHDMSAETAIELSLKVNGTPTGFSLKPTTEHDLQRLAFETQLRPYMHSIVEFFAPLGWRDKRRFGIAIGGMRLEPLPPRH